MRFPYKLFTLQTSFKPLLVREGGGGVKSISNDNAQLYSNEVNSYNLCPNNVQEFSLSYFTSPFAIAKGLEMRLSVSPATLFSDGSPPNHTKMFVLVHMVTSMDDFGGGRVPIPTRGHTLWYSI